VVGSRVLLLKTNEILIERRNKKILFLTKEKISKLFFLSTTDNTNPVSTEFIADRNGT
jgi:hypothetical protein